MAAAEAQAPGAPRRGETGDGLAREEKRRLAVLGLPTFGLALAITVVSSYVPSVATGFGGSSTVIGLLIGGEGLGALVLPVVLGSWSDRLRTPIGGRLPFVVAGVPVAIVGLVGMGVARSLGTMAVAVAIFFVGYFVAYEPYRALYPDLVRDEVAGRGQSTQAVWRGAGTGLALLGGGLLLGAGQALPFVAGAVVLALATGLFVRLAVRGGVEEQERSSDSVRETFASLREMLVHDRPLRDFFIANALWELALGALKTFVILWLTRGLGTSLTAAAGIVGAGALCILGGAAISGRLADRHGRRRIMAIALVAFGLGLLVPLLTTSRALLVAAVPFVAFGGGVLLSLPYALLIPLMPERQHGALTGFYSVSRGLGVMLGPLLGGVAVAIATSAGVLDSTHGYAAVWGVCSVAVLASLPFLREVKARDR